MSEMIERARKQARWRCGSCGGELTMPSEFAALCHYACCGQTMKLIAFEQCQCT